ncbi:hypothetical protein LTR37_013528 [Vermiconidia calcicola]|uniref:Uncharacterized protein n=1 Tax=Vermiconidia calcicola TaxID=1690605 RepID=A0ACC3MXQ0_9PEZI|nr:hypothetical protein LTR37_013528 [Vermiconidia calcicola]
MRDKWDHFDEEYPMPTRRHSWLSSWGCTDALRRLDFYRTLILNNCRLLRKFENRRNLTSSTIDESLTDILSGYLQKPFGPESHTWVVFCVISDLDLEYNERRKELSRQMDSITKGFVSMQHDYQDIHDRAFDPGLDGFLERKRICDEYVLEHGSRVEEAERRFECKELNKEDDAVLDIYQEWKLTKAAFGAFEFDLNLLQKGLATSGMESARQT